MKLNHNVLRATAVTTAAIGLGVGIVLGVHSKEEGSGGSSAIACNTISQEADPSPLEVVVAAPVQASKDVAAYLAEAGRASRFETTVRHFGERVLDAACNPSRNPWGPFEDVYCSSKDHSVDDIKQGYKPRPGDNCDFQSQVHSDKTSVGVVANVGPGGSFTATFSEASVNFGANVPQVCAKMLILDVKRLQGSENWSVDELLPSPTDPKNSAYDVGPEYASTPQDAQAIDNRALGCLDALAAN